MDAFFDSWLETRLIIATAEVDEEYKMSVVVKGLADTVKQAKAAIDKAATVATKVNASATQLVATMAAVEDMTSQLDSANSDLQAALGQVTNGAPPLETGVTASNSPSTASAAPVATPTVAPAPTAQVAPANIHEATKQVEAANAAATNVQATADRYIPKPTP